MKLSVLVATASAGRQLTYLDCWTSLCNRARRELCASDGKTYQDECSWKKSYCSGNLEANTLLDFGSCQLYEHNCREKLAKCPKIYRPVCGSNGITFGNSCAIDHHNCIPGNEIVTESYKGECKKNLKNDVQKCYKSCKNNNKEKQVCGSDGKTYKNRCYLENEACDVPDLVVVSKGACPEEIEETEEEIDIRLKPVECPSFCNRALNPVCGSNYKTYANECVLRDIHCTEDERLTQIMAGPCGCPKLCPATVDEVCGSNGKTYSSPCHLARVNCGGGEVDQQDVEFAHWGACSTNEAELIISPEVQLKFGRGRLPIACNRMYRPVCATNGQTYANDCVAKNEGATIKHVGTCDMVNDMMEFTTETPTTEEQEYVPKTNCACHRALILVCGENGYTYGNECLAECDNQPVAKWCACEDDCEPSYDEEEDYDPELAELEEESPLCACNRMFKPVCTKSGNDYSNDCLAKCEGEEVEFDCACNAVNNGKCPDMLNDFGFGLGGFGFGGFGGFGGFDGFENDYVEKTEPEQDEEAEEEVDRCYQNCRRVSRDDKCGLIKGEYKNFKNWCELDVALCKNGGKDVTYIKVCGMKRNGNFKIFGSACQAEENNASVVDMSLCDDAREYNETPTPRKGGVFKPWKLRLLPGR